MNNIVVIGPKKTATSSVYQALKRSGVEEQGINLLPKESNFIINKPYSDILKVRQPFIDISPEYYTSFRALLKLKKMQMELGNVVVIVLERDAASRNVSHLKYMLAKDEISYSLIEDEVETLLLSNYKFHEDVGLDVTVFDYKGASDYLSTLYGVVIDDVMSNEGGFEVRSVKFLFFLKILNRALRKSFILGRVSELISPFFRKVIYKKSSKKVSCDSVDPESCSDFNGLINCLISKIK